MRIIAGVKRGMNLYSPKGDVSRPITDRVKESLFNVLYNYGLPEGKIAADLFCGVGSMGLEAISRGAKFVAFVEKDARIVAVLKKNIDKAGFVKKSKVIRADAFKVGAPVDFEGQKYDIIFIDPPYMLTQQVGADSPLGGLLGIVAGQMSEDGVVVVRTSGQRELLERYGQLAVIERRQWGTMAVNILRRQKNEE